MSLQLKPLHTHSLKTAVVKVDKTLHNFWWKAMCDMLLLFWIATVTVIYKDTEKHPRLHGSQNRGVQKHTKKELSRIASHRWREGDAASLTSPHNSYCISHASLATLNTQNSRSKSKAWPVGHSSYSPTNFTRHFLWRAHQLIKRSLSAQHAYVTTSFKYVRVRVKGYEAGCEAGHHLNRQ